jgi:hypothetical protein
MAQCALDVLLGTGYCHSETAEGPKPELAQNL